MRVIKTPGNDYYIVKSYSDGFIFRVRAFGPKNQHSVCMASQIYIPKELVGKKLMFKVEVLD